MKSQIQTEEHRFREIFEANKEKKIRSPVLNEQQWKLLQEEYLQSLQKEEKAMSAASMVELPEKIVDKIPDVLDESADAEEVTKKEAEISVYGLSAVRKIENHILNEHDEKKLLKREINGIQNGNETLEKALGIRAKNIGNENSNIGKKIQSIEQKKSHRRERENKKEMLQRAKMNFIIETLLEDEKETDKIAGVELIKKVFFTQGKSIVRDVVQKSGNLILFVLGAIAHFFLSVFAMLFTFLCTLMLPVLLAGVCLLTVYSAVAYVAGFFNFGSGDGIVRMSESEINLMDKANELYNNLDNEINYYKKQTRVTKNTEREYVLEQYKVTYPMAAAPLKGDVLTCYLTDVCDITGVSQGEILPFLNINTVTEENSLKEVFQMLNYMGPESVSEKIENHLVGYEQKDVVTNVFVGYDSETETTNVPAGSYIYSSGRTAGSKGGNCYTRVNTSTSLDAINVTVRPEEKVMYGCLHTGNSNGLAPGAVVSAEYMFRGKKVVLKVQIVDVDTKGTSLIRNMPYIELYKSSLSRLSSSDYAIYNAVLSELEKSDYVSLSNLKTLTEYSFTTTRYIPKYEEQHTWVDDTSKPIYKKYTYRYHTRPVYYKEAAAWKRITSLSTRQEQIYQKLYESYHNLSY